MHNEIKIDDTNPMPGRDRSKDRKLQFEWLETQPERQILLFLVSYPMGSSHIYKLFHKKKRKQSELNGDNFMTVL